MRSGILCVTSLLILCLCKLESRQKSFLVETLDDAHKGKLHPGYAGKAKEHHGYSGHVPSPEHGLLGGAGKGKASGSFDLGGVDYSDAVEDSGADYSVIEPAEAQDEE